MTINDTRAGSFDTLDTELLVLDPDLEVLFAEVELALRRARLSAPPRAPVTASRARAHPALREYFQRLRGRRPSAWRATQRGPPPRWRQPICTARPQKSEVMPVSE
ncbi:hypothetical protein [Nocardia sp. NPDC005366]|uniref:hypothetical protein n=1 Tax=Nocardia sp. NPDC005366 TaxID=3156878 RepID=UPI0033B1DE69